MVFTQNKNVSLISFCKPNEDYLMREILRYIGNATSSDNVRIAPEVFDFTFDERKQFVKGMADVTGYIRRSNYAFKEPQYRVYFEIPHNWELVIDFCNLLKSIDIPVQAIDFAHPNMRDGNLKKYSEGKPDFWKKEHQVKVWALEYEPIGFQVIHKQEALDYFANKHKLYIEAQGKKINDVTLTKDNEKVVLGEKDSKEEAMQLGDELVRQYTSRDGGISCILVDVDENGNQIGNGYLLLHTWI